MDHPDYFLEVVFHHKEKHGDNLALCAGYERGKWRHEQFAEHVMEWLPEFALNHSELNEISHKNAVRMTKRAAKTVYQTEKYGSRGEFGEIFLHIAIRQIYQTIPAVSKIYYKSAVNETVKGFDAVHVVKNNDELELWIGETKFYEDIYKAIYDVSKEIVDHLETNYLRNEFLLIKNKIDTNWTEAISLQNLIAENTSLDVVFKRACIPVLLTYESQVVRNSKLSDEAYLKNIREEINVEYTNMRTRLNKLYRDKFKEALPLRVHVILVPLHEKVALTTELNKRLKAMQS